MQGAACRSPAEAAEAVLQAIYYKKNPILSTGLPRLRSPQKLRCRLPIKNLTPHYNSEFCVSFHICQEAPRRL